MMEAFVRGMILGTGTGILGVLFHWPLILTLVVTVVVCLLVEILWIGQ
jgi:hypothetical protein